MSISDIGNELTSGKPLFSLQVDDLLVQDIFQKLSEQIKQQNIEIAELKKELASRPTVDDIATLRTQIASLQSDYSSSSSKLNQTFSEFRTYLDNKNSSVNSMVESKVNEIILSLNAAISRELENLGLGSKNRQVTYDSILEIKRDISTLEQKEEDVKNSVVQIAAAIDGSSNQGAITRKTAAAAVKIAISKDREKLNVNNQKVETVEKKLEEFKSLFDRVFPVQGRPLPQFSPPPAYGRGECPEFGAPPKVASAMDYFEYISRILPQALAIIAELHAYISNVDSISQSKLDKVKYDTDLRDLNSIIDSLAKDAEDYREKRKDFVMKDNFEELASNLLSIVNGSSVSSATNTRCIACGKAVQRVSGSIVCPRPGTSQQTERCASPRTTDLLKVDGLSLKTSQK